LAGNNCIIIGNHIENRTSVGLATYGIYAGSTDGHIFRDNRIVAMTVGEVFSEKPSPPVVPRAQEFYADHTTSRAGADTTEDTLKAHA
jgi:hypothetical protein